MKSLRDWLDQRTGYRHLLVEALQENVPGGARWRYVWGSTLTFLLGIQVVTGLFLWLSYSPSSQTAWESVYYIQHEMLGGWFLRGLHHYAAHAMNVVLVLHLLQVVIDKAYTAPREVNFWFGLLLLVLVLAVSLTGYLLPWDQKGYWATKVATNIAAITPFIGAELQKVIVGGAEAGHHTLTRFFALHAGILPAAIAMLVVAHVYLFRRHGLKAKEPKRKPDETFWPGQVLLDKLACLGVLAVILWLTIANHGAGLSAPADPSEAYSAARPEWYFMFLFQFLKYFPGGTEVWGAIVIPGVVLGFMFIMPFLGGTRLGHRFNVAALCLLVGGAGLLTWLGFAEDRRNPEFVASVAEGERDARRVVELARAPTGIPPIGAVELLRTDPLTQGPKLFARNCATCHRHGGHDGLGHTPKDPPSAADLKGLGSRAWVAAALDPAHFTSTNFFGGTKFADGKMAKFLKKSVASFSPEQKAQLEKVALALSAEAKLKSQRTADARDTAVIAEGRRLFSTDDMQCIDCHKFHGAGEDGSGPELTGYGSREWLISFITNPAHERHYGKRNDRMPSFGPEGILDAKSIALLADWLRGEWYQPPAE